MKNSKYTALGRKTDVLMSKTVKDKEAEEDDEEYEEEEDEEEEIKNKTNIQKPKSIQISNTPIGKKSISISKKEESSKINPPFVAKTGASIFHSKENLNSKIKENISIRRQLQEKKGLIHINTAQIGRKYGGVKIQGSPKNVINTQPNSKISNNILKKEAENNIIFDNKKVIGDNYTNNTSHNDNVKIINNNFIYVNNKNEDNEIKVVTKDKFSNLLKKKEIKKEQRKDNEETQFSEIATDKKEKIKIEIDTNNADTNIQKETSDDNNINEEKKEENLIEEKNKYKNDLINEDKGEEEKKEKKYVSEEVMIQNGIEIYKCTEEEQRLYKERYEKMREIRKKQQQKKNDMNNFDDNEFYDRNKKSGKYHEDRNRFKLIRGKSNFEKGWSRERRFEDDNYYYDDEYDYINRKGYDSRYNDKYNFNKNRGRKYLVRGKPNIINNGWGTRGGKRYY